MGFMDEGSTLPWPKSKKHLAYVREHGIEQFIETYNRVKGRANDVLLWGDEVEYHLVQFSPSERTVKIAISATDHLRKLEEAEKVLQERSAISWHPEYGEWMIEGTPAQPYGNYVSDLLKVEYNMSLRRRTLNASLRKHLKNENQENREKDIKLVGLSCTSFPLLGVGDFTVPSYKPNGPVALSKYVPDECINRHPRFATLTANIRKRRGSKVLIQVPLFEDEYTVGDATSRATTTTAENNTVAETVGENENNHQQNKKMVFDPTDPNNPQNSRMVDMDCMAFGMGNCCLQITFQARDISESRYLYDQLAVLAPIMMALSAACPILKGTMVNTDVRWHTISASVDCRTPLERGKTLQKTEEDETSSTSSSSSSMDSSVPSEWACDPKLKIRKSRYDSVDCFISDRPQMKNDIYNDNSREIHEASYKRLREAGIDEILAQHIAHLFIRDPLVIYDGKVKMDDTKRTDHFENIQSTNWQTMRWKPPPPPPSKVKGWRVEFRSMDCQWADCENAAYTVFVVLLSRLILLFDLNLYIPMSKVDENMRRAHAKDAATKGLFYFRKRVTPLASQCNDSDDDDEEKEESQNNNNNKKKKAKRATVADKTKANEDEYVLMSCEQILLGLDAEFPGLVSFMQAYLDIIDCPSQVRQVLNRYIQLIVDRATGKVPTRARWIRDFVQSHPDYKDDSIVPQSVAYD
eukprot:g2264.t1